ncbi:HIT family protein [Haloplanus sp. GCM10025708]|uniref:HIT family protein n=1 Tax=Haloferacaceae TaxID=1644056 RepID=UPI003605F2B0
MTDCIFCRIVDGDLPSRTVYEDDHVQAFLDANPLSRGHTLVVPKSHHERVHDLPESLACDLFAAVHGVTGRVERAVDADATTVAFNDGPAAGQEVNHVHCHVVPRFEGDGGRPVHAVVEDRPNLSDEELDAVAAEISGA